jgi:hypothetical protein
MAAPIRMIITMIKMASTGYPLDQLKVEECKEINTSPANGTKFNIST